MAVKLDLLRTREAAALLGVNISTISRWVAKGRITPTIARGGFVFTRKEILRAAAAAGITIPEPQEDIPA